MIKIKTTDEPYDSESTLEIWTRKA